MAKSKKRAINKAKISAPTNYFKINPKALSLSLGIIGAVSIFILGILPILFNGWGASLVSITGSLYKGYSPSFGGAIIGAIWGFIDGYIGGLLIAWLYNKFL